MSKGGAKIYGLEKVMRRFQKELQDFAGEDVVVEGMVGYRAPYAIYVHENMEIDHPLHVNSDRTVRNCGGQAKFLEQPAREMIPKIADQLMKLKKQKKGLKFSIQTICDRLLRESQKLVPVLSGKLKKSGFTKVRIKR